MSFCAKCGCEMKENDKFCPECGARREDFHQTVTDKNPAEENRQKNTEIFVGENKSDTREKSSDGMKWYDKMTDAINRMAGGTGAVRPPLKSIFSKVFAKHEKNESEEIFICGTVSTTPELSDDEKAWPRPWLWSRILLVFAVAFLLLYICCSGFGNTNLYPGLMVIGSFMVPIATMVFFFELNTPKNISFFTTLKYFLIGGCASIVVTLIFSDIFSLQLNAWLNAVLVGIIEESAKLAIVAFVIWRDKNAKYALNGLLIGAAIGAGFAAFESAGYAFNQFMKIFLGSLNINTAYSSMIENIFMRAILAPGGHVVWAAIAGYAVMLVRGDKQLTMSFLNKKAFWKIFWIPIALHSVWDMPIYFGKSTIGMLIPKFLLVILAWVVIMVLIGNSLSQIGNILKEKSARESKISTDDNSAPRENISDADAQNPEENEANIKVQTQ